MPPGLGHLVEGAGALGRIVKFKESPWFVEVFLVKKLEASPLLRTYFSQQLNVILVFFLFLSLFFLCVSEKLCVNLVEKGVSVTMRNVMGIIHGNIFISRRNQLKISLPAG